MKFKSVSCASVVDITLAFDHNDREAAFRSFEFLDRLIRSRISARCPWLNVETVDYIATDALSLTWEKIEHTPPKDRVLRWLAKVVDWSVLKSIRLLQRFDDCGGLTKNRVNPELALALNPRWKQDRTTATESSPLTHVVLREELGIARETVDTLPEQDHEALRYRFNGISYRDIALIQGRCESTIRARVRSASPLFPNRPGAILFTATWGVIAIFVIAASVLPASTPARHTSTTSRSTPASHAGFRLSVE